jgi:hypothetical protein
MILLTARTSVYCSLSREHGLMAGREPYSLFFVKVRANSSHCSVGDDGRHSKSFSRCKSLLESEEGIDILYDSYDEMLVCLV